MIDLTNHEQASHFRLNPIAPAFLPSSNPSNPYNTFHKAIQFPNNSISAPQRTKQNNSNTKNIKFPNNSIRQRTSNVNISDPENEFLQTSVDSCRSTIVQQETEIKRLKESQDVRNKRIMQLESQVGHAASHINSRNIEKNDPNILPDEHINLAESVKLILSKLESMISNPPNINISNNQNFISPKPTLQNKSTQTVYTKSFAPCNKCKEKFHELGNLKHHNEKTHEEFQLEMQLTLPINIFVYLPPIP